MTADMSKPDTINLDIEQGAQDASLKVTQDAVARSAGGSRCIAIRAKNLYMTLQAPFSRVMHEIPDSPPPEPPPPSESPTADGNPAAELEAAATTPALTDEQET